jgi:ABC-type polysaccharide/polyol phosphate export permease
MRQSFAIVEKNIYLELRVKSNLIMRFINPIIQLFILIFIFGLIFSIREDYNIGYWNANNYVLFLLISFCIQFSRTITIKFNQMFYNEKYWKTLSALMVAPVNRFTLLFGTILSELVMMSIPLIILFIIALVLYPISIFYIFLIILVFLAIYLILASIGLLIGALGISNEEFIPYVSIILRFIFLFSCTNYPKEIFPEFIQIFIILNPFYYLFDLLRLIWYLGIDYEIAITLISPIHYIVILSFTVLTPIISVYLFNRIYKKYGITGY